MNYDLILNNVNDIVNNNDDDNSLSPSAPAPTALNDVFNENISNNDTRINNSNNEC